MKQIRVIHEKLLNGRERLIHKLELMENIIEFNKKFNSSLNVENTVKYLTRHNYVKRVFLEYYYVNSFDERKTASCDYEDRELLFLVLNKLGVKWYVGLGSALYASGINWQIPNTLSIVNNKFSGERRVLGLKVKFYKMKEKLIFGLKKSKTKNNVGYGYSLPEKTYLDLVYLRVNDSLVKTKSMSKYVKRFPKWVGKK